jgi:streptogramin lyase
MEQQVQHVTMQPGEQAPSQIEEKQTLTPVEERRRMTLLVRILGVEVALLSGFLLWATLDWSFLLMFLGAFAGALLLRSWWALLIVPVAFAIGMTLGAVLLPLMQGGWPALQDRIAEGFEPLDVLLVIGPWLVLLSAAGGTAVGVALSKGRKPQISNGERTGTADTTASSRQSSHSGRVSPGENTLSTETTPSPPPVPEHRIRPRHWRLVMLLLIVVAPLATVALAWWLVLPSPKPADCGQPIDAARSGAVAQFCFPKLKPQFGQGSMTAGPDGSVWFTEGTNIARITPAGTLTEFPVPPPDVFITAGPDGNLWFSGAGPPSIVRMSTHGDVKVFALPQHSHDPAPLIVGPDGNLWFTEGQGVGIFAKMTLAGQITEFSLPFEVSGLAPASDGNLWVMGNGVIGRITPDGVLMTRFAVATDKIAALTAGPDGNLWFLENDGHVGRITLAGEVKRFPAFEPTQEGGYGDIIAGPDGNLWFSAQPGQIGRITPSGVVTLFPLPPKAEVGALAAGPDGRIWFTRSDPSDFNRAGTFWWTKIGRITP